MDWRGQQVLSSQTAKATLKPRAALATHSAGFPPAPPRPKQARPPLLRAPGAGCAHTSSLDTDLTRNTRAPHFTPQHWLLCHMGLYDWATQAIGQQHTSPLRARCEARRREVVLVRVRSSDIWIFLCTHFASSAKLYNCKSARLSKQLFKTLPTTHGCFKPLGHAALSSLGTVTGGAGAPQERAASGGA